MPRSPEQRARRRITDAKLRQEQRPQIRAYARKYYVDHASKLNARSRVRRRDSGAYTREKLRKYGLTSESYARLLSAQGNKCAICATTDPGLKRNWDLDHDHTTGSVRGILCHQCNKMLGQAHDDVEHLRAAIAYLENPPAPGVLTAPRSPSQLRLVGVK